MVVGVESVDNPGGQDNQEVISCYELRGKDYNGGRRQSLSLRV